MIRSTYSRRTRPSSLGPFFILGRDWNPCCTNNILEPSSLLPEEALGAKKIARRQLCDAHPSLLHHPINQYSKPQGFQRLQRDEMHMTKCTTHRFRSRKSRWHSFGCHVLLAGPSYAYVVPLVAECGSVSVLVGPTPRRDWVDWMDEAFGIFGILGLVAKQSIFESPPSVGRSRIN